MRRVCNETNPAPLSAKCRIRHFADYAEEKQMPRFLSIFSRSKEMAPGTSA